MKDWLWFCLHNIHDLSSQRRSEKVFSFLHVEHQFESLFNSSTDDKNVFLVSYVKPNHRLNFTVQWVLSKKLTIFCPFAYLCDASTVLPADWLVFREIPKVRPIALKGPYSWRNCKMCIGVVKQKVSLWMVPWISSIWNFDKQAMPLWNETVLEWTWNNTRVVANVITSPPLLWGGMALAQWKISQPNEI